MLDSQSTPDERLPLRRRGIRARVEVAAWAAIAWILIGAFVMDIRPISGPSMAPVLLGTHFWISCQSCGLGFACDAASDRMGAVCPNCGEWRTPLFGEPVLAGDRVLVDKTAWLWAAPKRWDLIVLQNPEHPQRLAVKRIVGLPGEVVSINRQGVSINGKPVEKPLTVLRSTAIPCWTSSRTTTPQPSALPHRWEIEAPWQSPDGKSLQFAPADDPPLRQTAASRQTRWAWYQHWRRKPGTPLEFKRDFPVPIHGYNQNLPELLAPQDRMAEQYLSATIEHQAAGWLVLRWRTTGGFYDWRLNLSTGKWQALEGAKLLASGELANLDRSFRLESAVRSGNWRVWADGVLLDFGSSGPLPLRLDPTSSQPFAWGAEGGDLAISDLLLAADISPSPQGTTADRRAYRQEVTLGPEEYYVLGDNLEVSADSRRWPQQGRVPRRFFRGKPILVWTQPGDQGRGIQVPAGGEIGYIR